MSLSIADLKAQRRWVLWRLEKRDGKETKVPYQSNGNHASSTDSRTWTTYAEVAEHAHRYSGIGVVMGEVDGIQLSGVDIDNCCDVVTGKFTAESREIVLGLDSYGEFSPSGTGAHILMIGGLRGRKGIKLPFPGAKAVEIYDSGRYFTFTDRHLSKTPADILEREDAVNALYDRVTENAPQKTGLTVSISLSEGERLAQLIAGDMSAYKDDHSTADFALCCLLAKKHSCNAFKIDAEFRESGLYRNKWERDDYREGTITRAVTSVAKESPVVFDHDTIEDDGPTEYLVECKPGEKEGWFPKGELSLIGAPSGVGKTSWAMPMLEKIRQAQPVWGHATQARDYRVLLNDRSKKATRRTAEALRLSSEALDRVIRLTTEQQKRDPAEILQACIEANPGVEVWFIEGLDLWIPDMNKMSCVAPIVDGIQRIATRCDVCVLATVGAPKQKGKDRYSGRDGLFGSAALARKVETIVLMGLTNEDEPNSVRKCVILKRNGPAETMYFAWGDHGLEETTKPDDEVKPDVGTPAFQKITTLVRLKFSCDEPIAHRPMFGPVRTYYRWIDWAEETGTIYKDNKKWFLVPQTSGVTLVEKT